MNKKRRRLFAEEGKIGFGDKPNLNEVGTSGVELSGGVYSEEFLGELQGSKGAEIYDKMRRRESQVSMLLDSIMNPIIAGNWGFEIDDENDAQQQKLKALCEWNFKHGLLDGMAQHIREVLTYIVFGYSVFEAVHATEKVEALDGQLVTFYKKFGFRKQASIKKWNLEKKTGRLLSIEQTAAGDVPEKSDAVIPGEFLLVFTNRKEGDNYEGISALRPMYGAYNRKDLYLKLTAMGVERSAVGVVIGTMPGSKRSKTEEGNFEAALQAYAENTVGYIKTTQGWTIDVKTLNFDPQKMVPLLNYENEEMARAVVAGFLMLGAGGGGGSYSLGTDLSDFFLGGIQAYANLVCDVHNRKSIPSLCQLNYGPQKSYPKMKCTGINDKAGLELADIISKLLTGGALKADDKLEDFLRGEYRLPKADPTTAREKPMLNPFGTDPNGGGNTGDEDEEESEEDTDPPAKKSEKELSEKSRVLFAEGYRTQFNNHKAALKEGMQKGLGEMAEDLTKKIRRNWNAATDAQRINAGKGVSVSTKIVNGYKKAMRGALANIASDAIAQARKEVPKAAAKVKFAEYEDLNPVVRRAIETYLNLVVTTQVNDIEKMVLFQFASSAGSMEDIDAIINDINSRVAPMLEGSNAGGMSIEAAAGDLTAQVTQNSRNSFFFAPEVLDEIESFTFTNEDPVSEICQNLNGQTFLATDPAAEQFYPPLHHNCKSRLVPNGKGEAKVTGIAIKAETTDERLRLEKQMTLCDHDHS